jgi:hypothetical protein
MKNAYAQKWSHLLRRLVQWNASTLCSAANHFLQVFRIPGTFYLDF